MPIASKASIRYFFERGSNPYYIYTPSYTHNAAGVRCLHVLCHALNELGYEAYLPPGTQTNSNLRTPCLTPETLRDHYLSGKTPISVYPETIQGAHFQTPAKVYWLLNRPGHLGGPKSFPADALIYHFSPWIESNSMSSRLLTVPLVDLRIFNNDDNEFDSTRTLSCYYAHKYLNAGFQVSPEISDTCTSLCQSIPRSAKEIASILRRSKVLYCYEQSAVTGEALLCGCPVVLVPSIYLTKDDWHQRLHPPGMGWIDEENVIARLSREVGQYRTNYDAYETYTWALVDDFALKTQEKFLFAPRSIDGSKMENLWLSPPDKRHDYLDEFLEAASQAPLLAGHSHHIEPALLLSHWVDQAVSEALAGLAVPPPAKNMRNGKSRAPLPEKTDAELSRKITRLIDQGKQQEALQLMEHLVDHDTIRWEVYDALGGAYIEQERLDEAIPVLLKGSSLEFISTTCLRKLGVVYALKNETWRVLAICTQILKREPDDQDLLLFVRDVLLSTSPRLEDIAWLAPEWASLQEELALLRGKEHTLGNLLRSLQAKARDVLERNDPFKRLRGTS